MAGYESKNGRSRGTRKKKNTSDSHKGFINRSLTENELVDFDEKYPEFTFQMVCDAIAAFLGVGIEVRFQVRDDGQTVMCILYDRNEDSGAYGWMLTSFAGSYEEALMMCVYKHYEIFECVWQWSESDKPRRG